MCPTAARAVVAASSPGVPRAETYAANWGSTSPRSAHSSSAAESRVVRGRSARTCASWSGVCDAGGAVHRDPAADHVVAEGREAAAAPDEQRRAAGAGRPARARSAGPGWRARRAPAPVRRGTATSTARRTGRAVPSTRSTPSRTTAWSPRRGATVGRGQPQPARDERRRGRRGRRRSRRPPRRGRSRGPRGAARSVSSRAARRAGPAAAARRSRGARPSCWSTLGAGTTVCRCEVLPTIPASRCKS